MSNERNGRKFVGVLLFGFVLVGAILFALSQFHLTSWDVKHAVYETPDFSVDDFRDENGRFVMMDYPSDIALTYVNELCDYHDLLSGFESVDELRVTDEELDEYIDMFLRNTGMLEMFPEGVLEYGDLVQYSISTTLNGQKIDSLSIDDDIMWFEEGCLPDMFVESMRGVAVGDEVTFDVLLDDSMVDSHFEYFGETVSVSIIIHAIGGTATLNSDVVRALTNDEISDVDEFRKVCRDSLLSVKQAELDSNKASYALSKLIENSTFNDVPSEYLRWYVSRELFMYQVQADMLDMTVEEYLVSAESEISLNDILLLAVQTAPDTLKRYAVVQAVADKESIVFDESLTDDIVLYDYRISALMNILFCDNETTLVDVYHESNIMIDVLCLKTMDWIMANQS